MAEVLISDHAETIDGYGATPPEFSSSTGVGISSQSAGFLLPVSGTGRDCLGIGTVVAVPGGMVHCGVEGLGE